MKYNISDYENKMTDNYRMLSLTELALEYYLLYDIWEGGTNRYMDSKSEECEFIHKMVQKLVKDGSLSEDNAVFDEMRALITEKMQVATAYVDRLIVYEHVLNRIEARCTMDADELKRCADDINKEAFIRDIVNFIFEDKDSVAINDRLHTVLGQLPVRMAKSKYLELIKNSINLYSESDVDSLDGYIYMLRTTAMIYEPSGMDKHFTEFADILKEFDDADFNTVGSEYYTILREKLNTASEGLRNISDIYMIYQKIINMFYVYNLNEKENTGNFEKLYSTCINILSGLNDAFNGALDDADNVEQYLSGLEGAPESMYEDRIHLESLYDKVIEQEGASERMKALGISKLLFSDSIFAELDTHEAVPVTREYLNQVTEELLSDIRELFAGCGRSVMRSIMALTFEKLPVFFNDANEVLDFIKDSLYKCSDDAELIATSELLNELILP